MKTNIEPSINNLETTLVTIKITFEEKYELNMFAELLSAPCAKEEFKQLYNLITEEIKNNERNQL